MDIPHTKLDSPETNLEVGGIKSIYIPKMPTKNNQNSDGKKIRLSLVSRKRIKKILTILAGAFTVFMVLSSIIAIILFPVYKRGIILKDSMQSFLNSFNSYDYVIIKSELGKTKTELDSFAKSYRSISWMRAIPFMGGYIEDGGHLIEAVESTAEALEIILVTLEPYADIAAFEVSPGVKIEGETAQQKLDFLVSSLPGIAPKADELAKIAEEVKLDLSKIDASRYPEKIGDIRIRSTLESFVGALDYGAKILTDGKPLIEKAPYFMGSDGERTYLIVFQNDKELRPTGGFMTAYTIAKVNRGKFEPILSSDIYDLDEKYIPNIKAADPFIEHIQGPYVLDENYRLRDMNWDPDFATSMEIFSREIKSAGIDNIDGIIAVDTELLVYIIDVLGYVEVPGYGRYSTEILAECDCPQIIYELESFADVEGPIVWSENDPDKVVFAPENYDDRKGLIGPLMNAVLSGVLGQSGDRVPGLFEAAMRSLSEKHVLFYMFDEEAQAAVESFGIGGTIVNTDADYLHINDANLGGRKSNLYVTQEVEQDIQIGEDGSVEKTVTITYRNPKEYDGWLNSVLPNYTRIYVPEGSELLDVSGFDYTEEPYEEHGKTVFAGFFKLRPLGISQIKVSYKLPITVGDSYKLLIQKQPGTKGPKNTINIGGYTEEFYLLTDKNFTFDF